MMQSLSPYYNPVFQTLKSGSDCAGELLINYRSVAYRIVRFALSMFVARIMPPLSVLNRLGAMFLVGELIRRVINVVDRVLHKRANAYLSRQFPSQDKALNDWLFSTSQNLETLDLRTIARRIAIADQLAMISYETSGEAQVTLEEGCDLPPAAAVQSFANRIHKLSLKGINQSNLTYLGQFTSLFPNLKSVTFESKVIGVPELDDRLDEIYPMNNRKAGVEVNLVNHGLFQYLINLEYVRTYQVVNSNGKEFNWVSPNWRYDSIGQILQASMDILFSWTLFRLFTKR